MYVLKNLTQNHSQGRQEWLLAGEFLLLLRELRTNGTQKRRPFSAKVQFVYERGRHIFKKGRYRIFFKPKQNK